ncbi:Gfo/Idh/MocA family oxidoreductase [Paenibacillus sp. UMB4589-SE434]|uniref:Gfo/Idh/MocA family protein n=1 Tax=Paenibacillus sp. UMB4589-SE434 TaxID=3046314 RepID=UPI00254EBFF1|nr:Gfo/Idh/MocA family oxidoreductase [Paenibacillus sp. UMB4589-SE434]MDK8179257.1 Gfo/Idh/MocA family oxidoreductase [Paenibacillus sp. UMB4589-SE434]
MNWRIVVAGCGQMSQKWVEYALQRQNVEIVGLVDVNPEASLHLAETYHLKCGLYSDLREAIRRGGANIVMDVSIPAARRSVTGTALEAGCHVFSEKPMAATMREAVELMNLSKMTKKTYAIMQNRRYDKNIRGALQLLQTGVIGQMGMINADFFLGPRFGGFREQMASPLILDMAIHTFDQARLLTGATPKTVTCQEWNPDGSWYNGSANAVAIFEMDNGVRFSYRGSWCAQGFPTAWESSWRLIGSHGTLLWDGADHIEAEYMDARNGSIQRRSGSAQPMVNEGHWGCLDEMFDALEEGRKPETDSSNNIYSTAMVFAAIQSSRIGQSVDIARLLREEGVQ